MRAIRGIRSARRVRGVLCFGAVLMVGACSWNGPNSLTLPGSQGHGHGAYAVTVDLPDVSNIEPNTRVRVDDVDVGSVTEVKAVNWVARVKISLNGNVVLPRNATAMVGQTSLLGSNHIELAAPTDVPPDGRLADGDTITLDRAGIYPTTERTLGSLATVLNGGGLGQIQEITTELNKALGGRQESLRDLLTRLDTTTRTLNEQRENIIAATESLDELSGQFARDKDTLATAIDHVGPALDVLNAQRDQLIGALAALDRFSTNSTDLVNRSRQDLVANLRNLRAVFTSLADSGQSLNKSLAIVATFPFPFETIDQVFHGDAANVVAVVDLTLSRLDTSLLTNTPAEGTLTGLEAALGRTIGLPPNLPTKNPLLQPIAVAGLPIPGGAGTGPNPQIPGLTIPGLPQIGGGR